MVNPAVPVAANLKNFLRFIFQGITDQNSTSILCAPEPAGTGIFKPVLGTGIFLPSTVMVDISPDADSIQSASSRFQEVVCLSKYWQ
jgi:hypothetical protein